MRSSSLLVVGLLAASVVVITTTKTFLGLDLKGGVQLIYKGQPTPQSKVTQASLQRAVDTMDAARQPARRVTA